MDKNEIFWSIIDNENIDNDLTDINKISMNSKECGKNDLFVAIRGGNNYINEALEKGAYAVYDNAHADIKEEYKNKTFFVNDSVEFLQKFAKKWREALDVKVIGITGSNGKTTVKDITYQLLSSKYKGKKTEGNYNNHIGLPFTLLRAEKDDDFIILEMGMSDFGEIDLLGKISSPDISVITNIGESHLEFLKTKKNVFKAKTEIVPHTRETLVINGDDEYLKDIDESNLKKKGLKTVKILNMVNNKNNKENIRDIAEQNNNFYYGDIDFNEIEAGFSLKYFDENSKKWIQKAYNTNVLGEHNILNLTIAISVAKQMALGDNDIEKAIKNIVLTNMRFQIIAKGKTTYINDAYNASPMSMKKSLETFSKIYNDREKIAVIGDMLELGEEEAELHASIFDVIVNTNLNKLYLYGPRMKFLYDRIKENSDNENIKNIETEYFESKELIKEKLEQIKSEKVILIKASRGMKLEDVIG